MKLKYIILVALGAVSYGMLSSFAKIAYGQGYSAAQVTFAQAGLGALILWLVVFFKKITGKPVKLQGGKYLLLAGTSTGLSAYCYYLSVQYIPASLAIVLLMQVTWISLLLEWLISKKKPVLTEVVATLFILAGTVVASGLLQAESARISVFGVVLGLVSGVIYSLYIIFTARLGKDTPVYEKSALMMSGSAAMIFAINCNTLASPAAFDMGLLQWGAFLAVFGTVIPPVLFSIGMPKIGGGLSAILITLELPVAIFCAHIILNEQITLLQMGGIAIMLAAIVLLNVAKMRKPVTTENDMAHTGH
ncbi:hypothetical protein AM493_12460 [Flavobacterium akiainvivens]|uniref:EamA domain-containing protein n=1 Tax=Flavobacterium akiainvivens TaxID=1202724 RepID=A0A0M9VK02_9FLAO|nr:DMT family transporter [Flavobacterium akiainvivens]KOS08342.1 hypothetical protein AM493_12460 [Flavobacterium akiainvivens]